MASSSRVYKIDHHCLSHSHKFEIDSDTDEKLYVVHSTPRLLTSYLSLCEVSSGKELMTISEESSHLHISYDISNVSEENNTNQHLGTVKRIHGEHHFQKTFEINSIYGVYKVERVGGSFGHEIKLTTGNNTVVDVTKNVNSSKHMEVYHVEVSNDDGGDLFLLTLVIAIWWAQRRHHL